MGPQAIGACRCVYCCTCGTGEVPRYGCPCRCNERDKARREKPALLLPLPKKTWPEPRGFPSTSGNRTHKYGSHR